MMINYPDWYWIVGGDAANVWSSKRAKAVAVGDPEYITWLEPGRLPTPMASMPLLEEMFRAHFPPGMLTTYCEHVRNKTLNGGVTVNGLPFASDPITFGSLNSAAIYTVDKPGDTFSWKLPDGTFVTLGKADVAALHSALNSFGQACYACEDTTLTSIESGAITAHAQIDAAFAALNTSFTGLAADAQKVRHKRKWKK